MKRLSGTVLAAVGFGVLTVLACVACGGSSTATGPTTVTGGWARTSAAAETTGAVYFVVKGGATDDVLMSAAVPAEIAKSAELHQTMTMSSTGSGASSEMTGMQPVKSLLIGKGKTVTFQPGGYHVMLNDLVKPLSTGQTFTVTLTFDKAGPIAVPVQVRAA